MLEKPEGAIKNWQSRETGNIVYTIHRKKTNTTKNTTQKTKKNSNMDSTRNRCLQTWNIFFFEYSWYFDMEVGLTFKKCSHELLRANRKNILLLFTMNMQYMNWLLSLKEAVIRWNDWDTSQDQLYLFCFY